MYAFFIVSLVSIISADIFLSTPRVPAILQHVAPPSTEPPKAVEIKAATPEDPGPIATVVSPIMTLTKTPADTQNAGTQEPAAAPAGMAAADHVDATAMPVPNHFLHKRFSMTDSSEFAFTVPPHAVNPTLRGSFRAFTKGSSGSASSKPAAIDLMLMNEEEFDDFVHGRSYDASYEADSSPNLTVQYAMPHTLGRACVYHLVFRNSHGSRTSIVDADFTVSFQ
jgi:hypothetical protein